MYVPCLWECPLCGTIRGQDSPKVVGRGTSVKFVCKTCYLRLQNVVGWRVIHRMVRRIRKYIPVELSDKIIVTAPKFSHGTFIGIFGGDLTMKIKVFRKTPHKSRKTSTYSEGGSIEDWFTVDVEKYYKRVKKKVDKAIDAATNGDPEVLF